MPGEAPMAVGMKEAGPRPWPQRLGLQEERRRLERADDNVDWGARVGFEWKPGCNPPRDVKIQVCPENILGI